MFIGGLLGVINQNNQYSNKIVFFYFIKSDKSTRIFTKEINQIAYNYRKTDDYSQLLEFHELQILTSYNSKFDRVIVRAFKIRHTFIHPVSISIDPKNPSNSMKINISFYELDPTFLFNGPGIIIG